MNKQFDLISLRTLLGSFLWFTKIEEHTQYFSLQIALRDQYEKESQESKNTLNNIIKTKIVSS